MSVSYQPTPAALAREAERLTRMAHRALSCKETVPWGCHTSAYAARCKRLARELQQRAERDGLAG